MQRKLKEAAVKLDINGLESNDLQMLARMMELAGQAEQGAALAAQGDIYSGQSMVDINEPETEIGAGIDADNTGLPMSPEVPLAPSTEISDSGLDYDSEPEIAVDIEPEDALQYENTDEFADVVGTDDISTERDSMFGDEPEDDGFDINEMRRFAGMSESVEDSDEDVLNVDEDSELDNLKESSFLPDLSIREDSGESHGPFASENECVMNAQMETNGVKGTNFSVRSAGDGFYWDRTVQEDIENRSSPEQYSTDGITNSRHDFRHKRTKLGDNTILSQVHESADEEDEDEESVEELHESLNKRFARFQEGK